MTLLDCKSAHQFLSEALAERVRKNPRYSQRALARQFGLSPGELSEVMRGKRALSLKSALKIARHQGFTSQETEYLLKLIQQEQSAKFQAEPSEGFTLQAGSEIKNYSLTLDLFRIVSDWYCFAILSLADCQSFRWDQRWISRRLGISSTETNLALQRLERVGLIERKGKDLKVCSDYVISPAGIPSEAIKNYHRQILEKASQALDTQSVDEREFSGISLALDPKHLAQIRKEISHFQDELVRKYSQSKGQKKEVYHLETAFFRLTEKLQ